MSRSSKDSRLKRAGVSGYNKPKRTPNHPKNLISLLLKKATKLRLFVLGRKVQRLQANLKQVSLLR